MTNYFWSWQKLEYAIGFRSAGKVILFTSFCFRKGFNFGILGGLLRKPLSILLWQEMALFGNKWFLVKENNAPTKGGRMRLDQLGIDFFPVSSAVSEAMLQPDRMKVNSNR